MGVRILFILLLSSLFLAVALRESFDTIMSTGRGEGGAPRRFRLADEEIEEREGEGVVGDLSGSLAGLTILPTADPSLASYGWITGGGARTPAASAPSRPRSTFSVSLGLTTDVPSLRSAPALGARGGFGGGLGGVGSRLVM